MDCLKKATITRCLGLPNPPAFLGALKAAALAGKSVVIKFQSRFSDVTDDEEDFGCQFNNDGIPFRDIWLESSDGWLQSGSEHGYWGFGNTWRYTTVPGLINSVGCTYSAALSRLDFAGNDVDEWHV